MGRRRLAFDELLLVQLVLLRRRRQRRASALVPVLDDERSLTARWLSGMLPFSTGDQLAALDAVDADLAQSRPMQRLLMGEVGRARPSSLSTRCCGRSSTTSRRSDTARRKPPSNTSRRSSR